MNGLLIVTQEQAMAAIRDHIGQPGIDPALTATVNAVLAVHRIDPPEDGGKPWADCQECGGSGVVVHISDEGVASRHCHCQCPWCAGCDEALCAGPCPTVAAIARALGLLAAPTP
ncbi:hypothetical protein [Micromonospora sp. NPDC047730]|uniref:hypothetical protein n=1 Tax=Micromonospora sp. NPDC047730 TaxID=3364253 RepID=UPI0037189FEA